MYQQILAGKVEPSDPFGVQFTGRPERVGQVALGQAASSEADSQDGEESALKGQLIRAFRTPGLRR